MHMTGVLENEKRKEYLKKKCTSNKLICPLPWLSAQVQVSFPESLKILGSVLNHKLKDSPKKYDLKGNCYNVVNKNQEYP